MSSSAAPSPSHDGHEHDHGDEHGDSHGDGQGAADPCAGPARGLWSVDEHLADILATVGPLEPIELQLLDAQGCVLVEDVTVPVALPPFDNSSMDGYAVRVADVAGATEEFPAVLTVVGDVAAGAGGPSPASARRCAGWRSPWRC